MAKPNISLLGATYSGVAGVTLPKSGGGTATFPWVEGSDTVTQNDTYDVTNLAELVVNVSSVAPTGSSYTLLGSHEFTVNTTSTSAASIGTFTVPTTVWTKDKAIYIRIRDKAGKRAGYFYGTDNWFINLNAQIDSTADFAFGLRYIRRYSTSSVFEQYYASGTTGYGVYARSIAKNGTITIYSRYSSNYSLTINGTYVVEVYTLDLPGGTSPFA